jgi:2-oxoglutarate dehydrogenase E2 component (dihydrolipoamide succinyltransferase)
MNLVTSSHSGLYAEPPLSPTPLASAVEPPAMPAPVPAPAPIPVAPAPAPTPVAIAEPEAVAAPSERRADLPLEAQLVRMGLLSLEQLAEANRTRLESGGTVADIVVANGWVTPEQIAVLTGEPVAPAEPTPEPTPVVEISPPPAPAPEPETAPSLQLAEPAPPAPAPAPEPLLAPPAPAVEPVAPIAASPSAGTFCVALRLQGGERVDVLTRVDEPSAQARAREIVSELARVRPDEWPHYAGRFLRPDAIVSVDVFADD